MASINKAENMVGGWLKSVPHLPAAGQKWIAQNAWWIVLIGAIASAIGVLVLLGAVFTFLAVDTTVYYLQPVYPAGWIVGEIVNILFTAAVAIIAGIAVSPLKAMKKSGWNILFVLILLKAVGVVLTSILSFSIVGFIIGIIFGAIGVAIGTYFVFEIRSHFGAAKVAAKHESAKA